MNTLFLKIDNLKCGGCANSIKNNLLELEQVSKVKVDEENGVVEVSLTAPLDQEVLERRLSKLGYPPAGTSNILQKGKSYVSCAIGRVTSEPAQAD